MMEKLKTLLAQLLGIPYEVIADLNGRPYPCCDTTQRVALEEAFNLYAKPIIEGERRAGDCVCSLSIALLNGQATADQQRFAALSLLGNKLNKLEEEVQNALMEQIMADAGAMNPHSKVTIH